MKTGHREEVQVVFMEEEQEPTYRDSSGIDYDFFGCLEMVELRLMKRIDRIEDALEEQNRKLNKILEFLNPKSVSEHKNTKSKSPVLEPILNDHRYIEIPLEFDNTTLICNESIEDFESKQQSLQLQTQIDYTPPLPPPQKKRKLNNSCAEAEVVEWVECIEIIPQGGDTNYIDSQGEEEYQEEVEIEVEQIEELKNPAAQRFYRYKGVRHPIGKIQSIPELPIDNIEILRGFNKTLTANKEMEAEFTQMLTKICGDDKETAPSKMITAIIGHSLLLQSSWASKSSGRLRIGVLMGILNCVIKAARQASFGGFVLNFLREKVMELLNTLKTNPSPVTPKFLIKRENNE